jgi:hypothetical protein
MSVHTLAHSSQWSMLHRQNLETLRRVQASQASLRGDATAESGTAAYATAEHSWLSNMKCDHP